MTLTLILIAIAAACIGGQVNRGIYRLAWNKRQISPWSEAPSGAAPRTWLDCIPIYGWFRLRRESNLHGQAFWLRPLMIELCLATGLAALYWFEMNMGIYPVGAIPSAESVIQIQFLSHACLIGLLTVATFIDFDEQTIPDEITIPGMLLGFVLGAFLPMSLLPAWSTFEPPHAIAPLWLTQPQPWSKSLDGSLGIGIGIMCIVGWWYALVPKRLWYRSGLARFLRYLAASIRRSPGTPLVSALAMALLVFTLSIWWLGGSRWHGLLTTLVGMAAGGGVIWAVRVIANVALGEEAMGFGDVTLMGMIGAFMGWQPALVVFFLAPFTGIFLSLGRFVFWGRKDIAYGPFLSLAALLAIFFWPPIWDRWGLTVFSMGWLIPAIFGVCLLLMGMMLTAIRRFRS